MKYQISALIISIAIPLSAQVRIDLTDGDGGDFSVNHLFTDLSSDPVTLTITESGGSNDFGDLDAVNNSFTLGSAGSVSIDFTAFNSFNGADWSGTPRTSGNNQINGNGNGIGIDGGTSGSNQAEAGDALVMAFTLTGLDAGVQVIFDGFETDKTAFQLWEQTSATSGSLIASADSSGDASGIGFVIQNGSVISLTNDINGTFTNGRIQGFTFDIVAVVPEPSSYGLIAGILALSAMMLRRRK